MDSYKMFIDGQAVDAVSGKTMTVVDPGTGEAFAQVPLSDERDVDAAGKAARRAFDSGIWSAKSPQERADIVIRFADLIEANSGAMAVADSRSNGSPVAWVGGGLWVATNTLRNLAWYAANKFVWQEDVPVSGSVYAFGSKQIRREAIGVCAAIAPWTVPHMMALWKIAHALVTGNTVVLKPASTTPLSALIIGSLANQAGIPPGVINIVTGYGETAGKALVDHPEVDKIAFTGSTVVGKQILAGCAGNLKRVTLELGGKSPVFIFPDADLGLATEAAARGIFMNSGQVCAAGSRLFVHEKLHDKVVQGVIDHARKIKVGPGVDPTNAMGPLVSAEQRRRVMSYIESGAGEGAQVLTGGHALDGAGYFVEPTVLGNTTASMRVRREEIFGPVLCAMSFGDADIDALARLGNDTDYGLSAAIYTRDLSAAHKLARRLKAGTVRINFVGGVDPAMPLGGFKQSGWGRENGREGTLMYTEIKAVSVGL